MTKFLKNIFTFLIFLLPLYLFLLITWGEFAPSWFKKNLNYKIGSTGFMNTRLKELKSVCSPDILIVGSSTAYRDYDTRIFREQGISAFNLGSSAQTPIQTKYLLEKYLLKVKPSLLIIDVNPMVFTFDGIESSLDLISNDDFNNDLVDMAFYVNHLKIYNTLVFAKYIEIFNRNAGFRETLARNKQEYIQGGFVEYELSFNKKKQYENQSWDFKKSQIKSFDEVINFLKANNVNFILVQPPLSPAFFHAHLNNEVFDNYMIRHGRYLNFNMMLNLDDSLHFYDATHLNQNGVEIYNQKLLEVIISDSLHLLQRK